MGKIVAALLSLALGCASRKPAAAAAAQVPCDSAPACARAYLPRESWSRLLAATVRPAMERSAAMPVTPEAVRRVASFFEQVVPYELFIDQVAALLAREFADDELLPLAAFLRSPAAVRERVVVLEISRALSEGGSLHAQIRQRTLTAMAREERAQRAVVDGTPAPAPRSAGLTARCSRVHRGSRAYRPRWSWGRQSGSRARPDLL